MVVGNATGRSHPGRAGVCRVRTTSCDPANGVALTGVRTGDDASRMAVSVTTSRGTGARVA
jgi:hypothetical protein